MKLYNDMDTEILMKHLRSAYYEDIEKKYSQKKYKVFRDYKIMDDVFADLVAIKDEEIIIFEIKNGKMNQGQKKRLGAIKEYVEKNNENIKLKMLFLNPPQSKSVEFDKLSSIISDDIFNRDTPNELDLLSTHTRIEEISDVEIDFIEISEDNIHLQGNGIIEVSLQFGSDREAEEDEWYDSFLFEFDIRLNREFCIEDAKYTFNTESFYE